MGADPVEVLATAAVRDAANGPAFIAALRERLPDMPVRVLPGQEEGALSAEGVLLGFPGADGVLGDLGGGSLELVELDAGRVGPRGVACRSAPSAWRTAPAATWQRARGIAEDDLARVPWLRGGGGARPLPGRRRLARAGAHAHRADRLSAAHRPPLRAAAGGGARPRRRGHGGHAPRRWNACPARRSKRLAGPALRRRGAAPPAARHRRARAWCSAPTACARAGTPACCPRRRAAQDPLLRRRPRPRLPLRPRPAPAAGAAAPGPPALFEGEDAATAARCARPPAGSPTSAATTIPDYRAEHSFFRVLRQPGVGLDHHAARLPRAGRRAALRGRTPTRPSSPTARVLLDVAGACAAPRCWARRCAWPTRCRAARRSCWPAPRWSGVGGGCAAPGRRQRRLRRRKRAAPGGSAGGLPGPGADGGCR